MADEPGTPEATPATAPVSTEPTQSVTPEPTSETPPPSEGAFVHPRLGVAELREGWDPNAVPAPEPPPSESRDDS